MAVYINAQGNYYLSSFQQNPSDQLVVSPSAGLLAQLSRSNPYNVVTSFPLVMPERLQQRMQSVAIGNSNFVMAEAGFADAVNNSLNSRKICFAPTASKISDIVLAFTGSGLNNPETDIPNAFTAKVSVEYPLGSTPQRLYFNGADNVVVTPGRTFYKSDPLPISIPAGAQFAVKSYITWTGTLWSAQWSASQQAGEWTNRGTGLADNSLNNTVLTNTTALQGLAPAIYASIQTPIPVVGIIGDSIAALAADSVDLAVGYNGWGRAMRGQIPFINLGRAGETFANWNTRHEGRCLILRNAVTDVIIQYGHNDIFLSGTSAATLLSYVKATADMFNAQGRRCWGVTVGPRTTSTDAWLTIGNQTLASVPNEAIRQTYNATLLANYASMGLAGVFDLGHAIDPQDTGKWPCDPGAPAVTALGRGFPTMLNQGIQSVTFAVYASNGSAGAGYANNTTYPCVVLPYPNTTGQGAVVNAVSNAGGQITNYTVVNSGASYSYPPMVHPIGQFTIDGIHPSARGWSQCIVNMGLAPESFYSAP